MKLYFHPAACSLSQHIVCRELGLPVELVEVERKTHRMPDGGDFLAVNGTGYVPALRLDDGQVLTEGAAILQHLADQRPQAGLLPAAGSIARTVVQSRLNFIATELHKPMVMLFDPGYAPVHPRLLALVERRLDWLSRQVRAPYLTGEAFTVADAYLFVCLNWSPWLEIDLKRWPAYPAFMAEVTARPAVLAALAAEGLAARQEDPSLFAPRPRQEIAAEVRQ